MAQVVLNGSNAAVVAPPAATISTGGFFWKQTDKKLSGLTPQPPTPGTSTTTVPPTKINAPQIVGEQVPRIAAAAGEPPLLTKEDGNVLALLQKRIFKGKGFNTIFRPRQQPRKPTDIVPGNNDNVLQLNLTQESLSFSESLGTVPNRGFGKQDDLNLKGLSYVQKVDDITNPETGLANGRPQGIHFEPGVWLAIPDCKDSPPNQAPTLCRMGSIPHGTTINAQGMQPNIKSPIPGSKLNIPREDITPFFLPSSPGGPPGPPQPFPSQQFSNSVDDRLPGDLTKFDNAQVKIKDLLQDPNAFLRKTLADQEAQGQELVSFYEATISTLQTPVLGGGTTNIAFLGGSSTSPLLGGQNQNAHAVSMTATYWVETMQAKIKVVGNKTEVQKFQPAGPLGPTFVVAATTGLNDTIEIPVTWTQLQSTQKVLLNFGPLSWPHVSVATLAETTIFDVHLRAMA